MVGEAGRPLAKRAIEILLALGLDALLLGALYGQAVAARFKGDGSRVAALPAGRLVILRYPRRGMRFLLPPLARTGAAKQEDRR